MSGNCRECFQGLDGPTCAICSSDAGCTALRPDAENPFCDRNITYSSTSIAKTYSCNGEDIAGGVVAPGIAMSCNRTSIVGQPPISLTPDGTGPFVEVAGLPAELPDEPGSDGGTCTLQFSVFSDLDKPVMCVAWGCLFVNGFGRVDCLRLHCDCPNPLGCPEAIAPILPTLTQNAGIDCDPDTTVCTIKLQGLPLEIMAPCDAGECVPRAREAVVSTVTTFDDEEERSLTFAIASVPIAATVVLAVLVLVATIPRMRAILRGVSAVRSGGAAGLARSKAPLVGAEGGQRMTLWISAISLRAPRAGARPAAASGQPSGELSEKESGDDAGAAPVADVDGALGGMAKSCVSLANGVAATCAESHHSHLL